MFGVVMTPLTPVKVLKCFSPWWFGLNPFILDKHEGLWKESDSPTSILTSTCPWLTLQTLRTVCCCCKGHRFTELLKSWHDLQNGRTRCRRLLTFITLMHNLPTPQTSWAARGHFLNSVPLCPDLESRIWSCSVFPRMVD